MALTTTMKKRKLTFLLAFVIFVALGVVACIKILNVPREFHLTTIELPSGDRITFKYCYYDFWSAYLQMDGELKYDIYSSESHSSGQLCAYDSPGDIRLTHEIQGERRVKIEDGRRHYLRSWIFEGDSSGQYKVTELPAQKRN